MIEHLSTLIENFPGAANQTRCFTHILNLVAKSILRQFDTPKKAADGDFRDLDDASDARHKNLKTPRLRPMRVAKRVTTTTKWVVMMTVRTIWVMGAMGCQKQRWMSWRRALFQFG
jgi:hypothetical protein